MEESPCNLEIDVNGQEIFWVNKRIIASYSGRLRKLFGKSIGKLGNAKVIFHDFPGGAESFELMARFCYDNAKTMLTPSNICVLHCVAQYMEMTKGVGSAQNLVELTEKSLEELGFWSWSELLAASKQCQEYIPIAESSGVLKRVLDSLVRRLVSFSDESAATSSPESSALRFSCDTRSTESLKNSFYRVNWWFEELAVLEPVLIEKVINTMVCQKLDHVMISKFLFYYHKCKSSRANTDLKRKITESVIDMLFSLDHSSVPCKSLFGILRMSLSLNISKSSRNKIESMIGLQLDQATLDNLLVPSPQGMNSLYDVNLILRLLKSFLLEGRTWASSDRLKKVSNLMDLYIAEVAPDSCLKPSKFVALVNALPDSARNSYDAIYRAMDMYLEVHSGLSEEEKMKICCTLNYEKLSSEVCIQLTQNPKFPSKTAVQVLISQKSKLKNLLLQTNQFKGFADSPCNCNEKQNKADPEQSSEQIVLYAKNLDDSAENQKIKAHLQGMQWRVMELEKICKKMQAQMEKIMKSKVSSSSTTRALPRLCS
ncbi:hypothetical protein Sjap_025364 [Stephania japonica]|uniref:Phototropic-responsive NPH3 family protein n=1 Tax=Stephania japonica TaxID=461633 RepID=A0AAP0E9B9_9MAGN